MGVIHWILAYYQVFFCLYNPLKTYFSWVGPASLFLKSWVADFKKVNKKTDLVVSLAASIIN
jgi:hypothetical protein